MTVTAEYLPLQRLWHWERVQAHEIYLTQPIGDGAVRDFTWAQAVGEARQMASHLQSMGYPPGTRIAIMAKNSAWWYLADYAIMIAGHVSVPLYPSLTRESVRQILDHSEAQLCFVGKLDNAPEMEAGLPSDIALIQLPLAPRVPGRPDWNDIVANTQPLSGHPVRSADELATIIYTSGTTGAHKGVMHSFAAMAAAARAIVDGWHMTSADRMLSFLPPAHLGDRWTTQQSMLSAGAHVFFSESLETFVRDLQRAQPTIFGAVPRLWSKFQQGVFAKQPKQKLDRLFRIPLLGGIVKRKILKQLGFDAVRISISGAAPLPPEVQHWYGSLGLDQVELYGMTENFGLSHTTLPGREVKIGFVGPAWPGVEARLSTEGEILVKTPGATMGYYKQPELTRALFTEDGFIHTGDLGEIDAEGFLRIIGRVKEQFKTSSGKYVAPMPIENLLAAHPAVEAVCVAGVGFPQPFGLVMLADVDAQRWDDGRERDTLAQSLGEHLTAVNTHLAKHEKLAFIVLIREQWTVDNGLVTPTLKVKRSAIEKRYGPRFGEWAGRKEKVLWHE